MVVPAVVLRPSKEVRAIRQARQQAAAEEMGKDDAERLVGAIPNLKSMAAGDGRAR